MINPKVRKSRVVSLVCNTSSCPDLHFYQVPLKYSKGYSSYRGDKKFYADADRRRLRWDPSQKQYKEKISSQGFSEGDLYFKKQTEVTNAVSLVKSNRKLRSKPISAFGLCLKKVGILEISHSDTNLHSLLLQITKQYRSFLTLKALSNILNLILILFREKGIGILCESSARQTIHMKCLIFSEKYKK